MTLWLVLALSQHATSDTPTILTSSILSVSITFRPAAKGIQPFVIMSESHLHTRIKFKMRRSFH